MRLNAGRFARGAAPALATALLGSGCVAFNVGKPETFTHEEIVVEMASSPVRSEVFSINAQLQKQGAEAIVGLGSDIQEEFEKMEYSEIATIRKQKRLAIGLFPGAAEDFLMPDGALAVTGAELCANPAGSGEPVYYDDPQDNRFIKEQVGGTLLVVPAVIGTIYSLLCAPFDDWTCSFHSYFDPQFVTKYKVKPWFSAYDTSGSPKLKVLRKCPLQMRHGVKSCYECTTYGWGGFHHGFVGSHKYLAIFVDGPTVGPLTVIGTETKRRKAFAPGPFIAEFSIPALNHNDWKRVSAWDTQAAFTLPTVERDCTVEAVVSFREDNSVNGRNASDLTKQALAKAAGRQWRFDVALKGTDRADSGGHQKPDPVPQPTPTKDFEVVTIKPLGEGQYLVRVEVKDKSKTFSILHLIKPEVYRLVHEDFRSKNPVEPAQFVRESMRYETEEDGRILSFTGWVFSVRPIDEGWHYNDESRTGWVRLRIMGGIPAVEAERWAHENIGEIVKYKNVVLEEGRAPPPGAKFRSLSEHCENGVLTVEFEALQ